MSSCVQELNDAVAKMDEKQISIVLNFVKDMMLKRNADKKINTYKFESQFVNGFDGGIKIGLFKNEKLVCDNYDFDECNDEIAKIFGV